MAAIWQWLTLDNPAGKTATCSGCKAVNWRGGTSSVDFNTSNLMKLFEAASCSRARRNCPKLYETLREHITCRLKDVQAVGFTTDIMTYEYLPPQSTVLQANEFNE